MSSASYHSTVPSDTASSMVAVGEDYPIFHMELESWFYPQDQLVQSDPYTTDLVRVSLFYANDNGSRPPPFDPPPTPFEPPRDMVDCDRIGQYLTGFTIPYYGEVWENEVVKAAEGPPVAPVCPSRYRTLPFADPKRSGPERNALNQRKRMFWTIRIWGYVKMERKAKLYMGTLPSFDSPSAPSFRRSPPTLPLRSRE